MSAWVADGWDDSILGIQGADTGEPRVVYDLSHMLDTLMTRDGMSYQDAQEYLSYNVLGANVDQPGRLGPVYIETVDHL